MRHGLRRGVTTLALAFAAMAQGCTLPPPDTGPPASNSVARDGARIFGQEVYDLKSLTITYNPETRRGQFIMNGIGNQTATGEPTELTLSCRVAPREGFRLDEANNVLEVRRLDLLSDSWSQSPQRAVSTRIVVRPERGAPNQASFTIGSNWQQHIHVREIIFDGTPINTSIRSGDNRYPDFADIFRHTNGVGLKAVCAARRQEGWEHVPMVPMIPLTNRIRRLPG